MPPSPKNILYKCSIHNQYDNFAIKESMPFHVPSFRIESAVFGHHDYKASWSLYVLGGDIPGHLGLGSLGSVLVGDIPGSPRTSQDIWDHGLWVIS